MTSRSSAGGAAAAGGVDYQALVGAYLAVRILAESSVSPLWALPETVTLTALRAESGAAVDDTVAATSARGLVFLQSKITVGMSESVKSPIGEAFLQFVALYRIAGSSAFPITGETRALDPARDRIVLATSATTGPLDKFVAILRRLREVGTVARPRDWVTTDVERDALARGICLVRACWRKSGGGSMSWEDMVPFLRLVHITKMGLDVDEPQEELAKHWLRDSILVQAASASAAWKVLKDKVIGLAKRKSGVDLAELQRTLTAANLPLQALRSYEADIERFRQQSLSNLGALSRSSSVPYAKGHDIRIPREYDSILSTEASASSLLVIGEAGCGKSGILAVFAEQAIADRRDVIVLNAGELAAESLGQLRGELALEHEVVDVIQQWRGDRPGFLIIDGLDGAREERTAATLGRLIERVQQLESRWRVVATIRKFDLRNGKHWQKLMPGQGIRPYFDPAFDDVRHLNVGPFTPGDIEGLKERAPELHEMVATAPPAVADLLRVPFNLMLANELRLAGGAGDLRTVTTQLELLDRYWDRRLQGALVERAAYEQTLRTVTESMLQARRLYVSLASIPVGAAVETMLSRSVLVQHESRVQYPHHILFDYAVERLLLRPSIERTISLIENDRDLPIAIGPSLKLWLKGTWERDASRSAFWALGLRLATSSVPSIAKLISGTVAAEEVSTPEDCDGLVSNVATEAGRGIFMFVADAVTANIARVAGRRPNPWPLILDRLGHGAPDIVLHRGTYLLHSLLDANPSLEADEMLAASRFARAALTRAWAASVRNRYFVVAALRAVARTFTANPAESQALLRRALEPQHLQQHGHEELHWLARYVVQFVASPDFLVDFYAATLAATASADEQTSMSNSQILGLTSTKKQDLEGAHWQLGQVFPEIARDHSHLGAKIAVRIANGYGRSNTDEARSITFDVRGTTANVIADSQYFYRSTRDEEFQIVQALVREVVRIADDGSRQAELEELLRFIALNSRATFLWRELVGGMNASANMFLALHEIMFSKDVLSLFTGPLTAALRAHQALLSPNARRQIEQAILALRDSGYGDETAARLLDALGRSTLTEESIAWLAEKDAEWLRFKSENQRTSSDSEVESEDYGAVYVLREAGMTADDLNADLNKTTRRRKRDLASRRAALTDGANPGDLHAVEHELRGLLEDISSKPVHPALVAITWGTLAEVASALAERGLDSVADVLVQASVQAYPEYREDVEEQFARHAGWASGQARLEAVPGLTAIAARDGRSDVIDAIRGLSTDKVSAVRFQVGSTLPRLEKLHHGAYWGLLESLALDTNPTVVDSLSWRQALSFDAPRGLELLVRTYKRWLPHQEAQEATVERLFSDLLNHAMWTSDPVASSIVNEVANDPVAHDKLASRAVSLLRAAMTLPRAPTEQSPLKDEVRQRSIDLVTRVTAGSAQVFRELVQKQRDAAENDRFRSAAKLLIEVAQEVYFASLAYDEKHEGKNEKPDPKIRVRFYAEANAILHELASIGAAGSAHYLIETLASYIDLVDPAALFLLIADAVRAGRKGGYQYESLAVKEMVAIVERYLADFRVIFMDNAECRAGLRDILDTFVEAGWPETHRLVYSLDAIFR